MPVFIYKVRDDSGKILQGQMDASDPKDLRKKLDDKNYFIIDFSEKKSRDNVLTRELMPGLDRLQFRDLSLFCWQLYTMLNASLTLINSLRIIAGQTKQDKFRNVINEVSQRVEEGSSFTDALKQHPQVFSRLFIQMVNAGEVGGVLDEMIRRLAVYYEWQASINSRIRSAFAYPILLLVASIGVVLYLMTFVLPQFAQIFKEIGANIPAPTQILLNISVLIKGYWYIFPVIVASIWAVLAVYMKTEIGRYQIDLLKLRTPLFGDLIKKFIASQFSQTFSILVKGGIPIMTALDVVTETIGNAIINRLLKDVAVGVGEGKPIAEQLSKGGVFPDMIINMIRVGEETGSLDKMLDKVSEFYMKDVNDAIDSLTKFLEPMLMVGMAVVIGFISFAIFLPLAELMKSVKG